MCYVRYINYLLPVWGSDVATLTSLTNYFNNCFGLKITITYDGHQIIFLDFTLISDGQNNIKTCTYHTDTAGNTILHDISCHPPHVVKNIPLGELL